VATHGGPEKVKDPALRAGQAKSAALRAGQEKGPALRGLCGK
jgi:hypothetical protein